MIVIGRSVIVIISIVFMVSILLAAAIPARADGPSPSALPFSKTWGNSAGRTGCNATAWGKSDTTMGCSGANNNSKCILMPCKFCR